MYKNLFKVKIYPEIFFNEESIHNYKSLKIIQKHRDYFRHFYDIGYLIKQTRLAVKNKF